MLKSIRDLDGFMVNALDGNLGRVSSLLFDEQTWRVKYVALHISYGTDDRDVALRPEVVELPDWKHGLLPVNMTKEQIMALPEPEHWQHENETSEKGNGCCLWDMNAVKKYHIKTEDGESGKVFDFTLESDKWAIPFMAVQTGNGIETKYSLVPTSWINGIDRDLKQVTLGLHMETIRQASRFKKKALDSPAYIRRLVEHYGIPEGFY